MKRYLYFAGCLGLVMWNLTSPAQTFHWARQISGGLDNNAYSIAADNSGNVYFTGWFKGACDFDPGPGQFIMTSSGNEDAFVVKLNSNGALVWAKKFGGLSIVSGWTITLDNAANVYVTGVFRGTADFDPGGGSLNLTSAGSDDGFIIKLSTLGDLIWARRLGGTQSDFGNWVAVDASENVYVTGFFNGTADFDPGTATFNLTAVNQDAYIAKLDASGNFLWAKQVGGVTADYGQSISATPNGNVYVTGWFTGTADLDPGTDTFNLTANGAQDIFLVKLDSSGNFLWAKGFGGTFIEVASAITVDNSENVLMTGFFEGTVDFDPGPAAFNLNASNRDVFVIKFDLTGEMTWVKKMGGTSENYGTYLDLDAAGNVYISGYFYSTADFDPGPGTFNLTSASPQDMFITKLNTAGELDWVKQISGTTPGYNLSVAVDAFDNVYTTGWFSSKTDFDPGTGIFNIGTLGGTDVFVLKLSQTEPYTVQGKVFGDLNVNCTFDSSDLALPGILVQAEPGPYYGLSDNQGNYVLHLPVAGNFDISLLTRDSILNSSCSITYNLQLTGTPDTLNDVDFTLQASSFCTRLNVELGTWSLRRCFNNTYSINYRNDGTLPVVNAFVEIDFGHHYLQPQSSSIPWSSIAGNVYTFPIGDLDINQSGSFTVTTLLNCSAFLGSTICVTAHIYPDSVCIAPSIGWDKSETKVTGGCVDDSLVCFQIKNRSSPPSGNMQGTAPWRLYINDTLMTQGTYQLAGQDSLIQCYPANGKTYRLEADQRLGHPGNSHPKAIVEACGSPANFGFVNTVAQDDEDLFVETFCMEVTGSYDPNDKQVFPTGITANRYIKEDDELEYLIRFQNTGNDTAFKVVIRDTIQTDVIDIATLTSGASSHNYTFNIYGHGIAEWTFDNILLPDSNVNEPGSNGFVKFKAKLLPNIAPGTIVTNSADIYFDFNAPVITNEVWNTVFDTVLRGTVIISGAILTESGLPVPGVEVMLAGTATDSMVTTADGLYGFETESGGNYIVTPSKNNDTVVANGVTAYDILLMRRHLLAIGALPSPYKIIAAAEVSANGDTVITTQDIVHLRSLILGNSTALPGNRLWQFVSSDYIFTDTMHPFPFNKTRTYTNIISSQSNQNFIGIKLGDVNESWDGN